MNDKEKINGLIQKYGNCMNESDEAMTKEEFHENASVVGYLHGELMQMSIEDFSGFVSSQQPSPKESGEEVQLEVIVSQVEGTTAMAKVRTLYLGITFLDTLSFLKLEDGWKIYSKLFHVEAG